MKFLAIKICVVEGGPFNLVTLFSLIFHFADFAPGVLFKGPQATNE